MGDHFSSGATRHFLCYWVPPMLWGLLVLGLSGDMGSTTTSLVMLRWLLSRFMTLSPAEFMEINFYARKAAHVTTYAIYYFLWFRAFQGNQRFTRLVSFLYAMSLCMVFAVMDEGHQFLLANSRTGSIWDVALDLAGSSLGALLTIAFWPARPKVAPGEQ